MKNNQRGFSLIFVLVGLGLLSVTLLFVLTYVQTMASQSRYFELTGTRDRIWTSIEMMISQPAAIRNSARASGAGGAAMNVDLRNCVNGVIANQCRDQVESGFAFFSPVVALDAAGTPVGVQQISVPPLSPNPLMFDAFGYPCTAGDANCVFVVTTSFIPHCGPPAIGGMPANPLSPNVFAPSAVCTVAEYLEIKYSIDLDRNGNSGFVNSFTGKSGSFLVLVKKISGNDPQ